MYLIYIGSFLQIFIRTRKHSYAHIKLKDVSFLYVTQNYFILKFAGRIIVNKFQAVVREDSHNINDICCHLVLKCSAITVPEHPEMIKGFFTRSAHTLNFICYNCNMLDF